MTTISDPYAPKRKPTREPAVRRAPRNPPILRLRRLGITPAEEQEVLRGWAEMTEYERLEALDALAAITDDEVRQQIIEARTEEPFIVPGEVPDGTVDDVLDWVGDDASRAAAALEAERARPTPRKTVLAALEALTA